MPGIIGDLIPPEEPGMFGHTLTSPIGFARRRWVRTDARFMRAQMSKKRQKIGTCDRCQFTFPDALR